MSISEQALIKKISSLPENVQEEIIDFIDFLTQKHQVKIDSHIIPEYGSLKGTFRMADDFDEPLEDFKEYMSRDF